MSSPVHAFARAMQPVEEKATVGWLSGGTYIYIVPGRPGYIYVTMVNPGRTTIDAVLNLGVPSNGGMPVVVKRNGNVKYVDGADSERYEAWLATNPVPSTVGPHSHEFGAGLLDWVSTKRIKSFQTRFTGTGLSVGVTNGEYMNSGADSYFAGGTLTLSAPPTADNFWWAKVLFDPATGLLSAVYSSETATKADLTRTVLAAISVGSNIPLYGAIIRNGQNSASDETDQVDLRPWLTGSGGGGGGSSFYQTVQDNGTPVTQRPVLNFIGATVADNAGNDSTDITVSGGSGSDIIAIQRGWFGV